MRLTDARKVAIAGVLVAAVLAACLVVPAIGQVLTLEGTLVPGRSTADQSFDHVGGG